MPRAARILLENVCYHIIARGNQKQQIFIEQADYEKFLKLLARYKMKFPVRANFVKEPQNYLWSSYKFRVLGHENFLLDTPKIILGDTSLD